jgi:hypothetical protein
MSQLPIIIITAAFIVVYLTIFLFNRYLGRRRSRAIRQIAELNNFSFSETGGEFLIEKLDELHLFSQGHRKKISNILTGRITGLPVTVFDYSYTTGSGKSSNTAQQTVVYFDSDRLSSPRFLLHPENVFHKIGQVFGYKDIDFQIYPQFSSGYLLRGDDEDAVRSVFSDTVLSYFQLHRGLSTEGFGTQLIYYRANRRVSPEKIQSFIEEAYEVFSLFKK